MKRLVQSMKNAASLPTLRDNSQAFGVNLFKAAKQHSYPSIRRLLIGALLSTTETVRLKN